MTLRGSVKCKLGFDIEATYVPGENSEDQEGLFGNYGNKEGKRWS